MTPSASVTSIMPATRASTALVVQGPSVADMVKATDPAIDKELSGKLDVTVARMEAIKARAESRRGL